MNSRKSPRKKKTRRRKRQSKAEQLFGAVVIEGLGALALIALFVFARQASEVPVPEMAEAGLAPVVQRAPEFVEAPRNQQIQWRVPDSNRFEQRWNQSGW